MSFLDLLKRQKPKKVEFEDLDLPPAPPPMEKFDAGMGAEQDLMPELPPYNENDFKGAPELEQFEIPGMKDWEENQPEQEEREMLPAPQYRKSAEAQLPQQEYMPAEEEAKPTPAPYTRMPIRISRRHFPKSSYVNLNDLKEILLGIKKIRNDLGATQNELAAFEDTRIRQDRAYERLNGISHDLQKKLIYMDKNLFKGEKA